MPIRRFCKICNKPLRYQQEQFCSKVCKSKSQIRRITLTCTGCGKKFQSWPCLKRKTNYCSIGCYWDSTRLKVKRNCIQCGREFWADNSLIVKGFGMYCGRKCQFKSYPKKVRKNCQQCGHFFYHHPRSTNPNKYCSKTCTDSYKRDYVHCVCKNCNEDFQIPRGDLNRGRGNFCTRECFIKFQGESSLEKKVRQALEEANIKFIQEFKVGRYRIDFLIGKVALECDGEFWHMRRINQLRDRRKEKVLNQLGYKVVRLTGQQINRYTEVGLKQTILKLI